jgi:MipA family protein
LFGDFVETCIRICTLFHNFDTALPMPVCAALAHWLHSVIPRWPEARGERMQIRLAYTAFVGILASLVTTLALAEAAAESEAPPTQSESGPAERPAGEPSATTLTVQAPPPQPPSPWRLGVALGYGARTNPLIQSEAIPILVDLDIAWFGKRFFFDNGDVGATLVDDDWLTLNLVARVNSDRVFFSRTDSKFVRLSATGEPLSMPVRLTVPERNYAIEAGFEALTDGRWGRLTFAAHHDVSGTHGGYELYLDYGRSWRRLRWHVEPSVGLAFKSRALNDYYWGVRPEEANEALPAYEVGAGVNVHARLLVSYQLTRHVELVAVGEYEQLNSAAAGSPIVGERNVIGYFAGFGYRF